MPTIPAARFPELNAVVDALDLLLTDPRRVLQRGPIRIGSAYPSQGYFLLALLTVALAAGLVFFPHRWLLMGSAYLVALPVVWLWERPMLCAVELSLAGVAFWDRATVVRCPWELFRAARRPFCEQPGAFEAEVAVPVDPAVVPRVVKYREQLPAATGLRVRTAHFWFQSTDQAIAVSSYEVSGTEIADLLLHLGGLLGEGDPSSGAIESCAMSPVGSPTPTELDEKPAPLVSDSTSVRHRGDAEAAGHAPVGWTMVDLTRLPLPAHCCRCDAPTDATHQFETEPPLAVAALSVAVNQSLGDQLTMEFPFCPSCRSRHAGYQWRAAAIGLAAGFTVGVVATYWIAVETPLAYFMVMLTTLIGTGLGWSNGDDRLPIAGRNYSPKQRTVELRIENSACAARLRSVAEARYPRDSRQC